VKSEPSPLFTHHSPLSTIKGVIAVRVLVTGGAGYIGSHTVKELVKEGHHVVVLDNLSKGHRKAVPESILFEEADIADADRLNAVFRKYDIEAVVHFAAFSLVGESMVDPAQYFRNNVAGSLSLFEAMVKNKIKYIVFSSTAAVYGEPVCCPIMESESKSPTNNYGMSKLMIEQILHSFDAAYGLKHISLRYFNAAGADLSGDIGEDHEPETHLIPLVLKTALGQRDKVLVFGTDYPTSDGTCVRDYIHVTDLADAHILALDFLQKERRSDTFNLGNGQGFSVKEVIDTACSITGRKIPYENTARRAGDPAVLVAGSEKIKNELGWEPKFQDLDTIIEAAWKWHVNHPTGYKGKA